MSKNIKVISELVRKGLSARDSLILVKSLNQSNKKTYTELNENLTKCGFITKRKVDYLDFESEIPKMRLQIFKNSKFLMSINM